MKKTLTALIVSLVIVKTYAFDMSKHYPGEIPNCPTSSDQLLEVTKFLPPANSISSKGICYVKANYYSWWELINNQTPYELEVDAGICNSLDFVNFNSKRLIKATVYYQVDVSMCGSNSGCHYECKPIVVIMSF